MRKKIYSLFWVLTFLFIASSASAQFRSMEPSPYRNSGNIIKVEQQQTNKLQNFFNMKMSHSYEASFSSFGGRAMNVNTYTNTMFFDFNSNFKGRLDLALAHSPFGGDMPGMNQNRPQFFIRNLELNYKLSENASISFSYQENPYANGFGMFNPMYSRYPNWSMN